MKLKTKRLLAAALALSLTANLSLAAFAVTYDLSSNVYIIGNDDGSLTSYQASAVSADERFDTWNWDAITLKTISADIDITTGGKATDNSVNISGDVTGADINIYDTVFNVTDDKDAAINIAEDSTVGDLSLSGVTINVNEENTSGIEIGTGATVENLTLSDTNINLNAGNTSGIQVGTTAAEGEQDTTVNITIDGTVTIGEGVDDGKSVVVNTNASMDTIGNMTGGITVGGNMSDGEKGVDTDNDGQSSTTVTITGSEAGGTLNIGKTTDEEGNTVTEGVSTGILVHNGASVNIGDSKNVLEVNIDGTHRTYANLDNETATTNDTFVTVSGSGIAAYGDVEIAGSGTTVEITDTALRGISMSNGDLRIKDGANVSIDGVGGSVRDYLVQNTLGTASTKGTSNTYAGIYSSGGSVYVEGANLTVNDVQNAHNGTNFGVALDNTGNQKLVISDGATVDISNVTSGTGIGIAGNNLLEIDRSTVTVSDARDGIYLNTGALLYVHSTKMNEAEDILESGDDREVYKDENGETVTGETKLTLEDLDGNAITAYGADVEFIGDQVLVKITRVGNSGITMGVPIWTDREHQETYKYGDFTDVDEDGNVNTRHLYVRDSAQLVMEEVGYVGILVGNEDGGSDYNKVVEITGTAYVKIGTLDGKGNSIILWGGNNSLLVDDSTVEVEDDITFLNTMGKDPSTITINNGSKVVARSIRNYSGGVCNFYITGGTVEVGTVTDERVDPETVLDITDSTSLNINTLLWPTSGKANGDEKLTNFRLSLTDLVAILGDDAGTISTAESLEKYGFAIEYSNGKPVTLIFETYGADSEGNYIVYNKGGLTNLTGTEWYVVDLTKYTEGELEDLWVWTPAVVLSYYVLNENTDESWGEAADNDTNDEVYDDLAELATDYHDVIIRGQSLAFSSFKTDGNYNTIYGTKLADDGTIYRLDVFGNYINEDGEIDEDGYILEEKDGVYYLKSNRDQFYLSDEGDYLKAVENSDGTTSYYVVDAKGNYLDKDTGYVLKEVDGKYYLTINGNYVDAAGNVVNADSRVVGTLNQKSPQTTTARATLTSSRTTAFADAQAAKPNYTFKINDAFDNGKTGWANFGLRTRVLSCAQTADGQNYNNKNIFAGVNPPEDDDDDPDDTPEEPTPQEPGEPDPFEPEIPEVPVVPVTPETPAQPETPAETPEETPAETPADPEAPAETPETPASSTPKTGDDSNVAIYLVMAALSGAALIGLGVTGRKKNEEV